MGLLDKLLGGVVLPPTTRTRTSTGSAAHRPAAPGAKGTHPADRPANPMRQTPVKPKPGDLPGESVQPAKPAAAAPVEPTPEPPTESMASFSAKPAADPAITAEAILAELFAESEKESPKAAAEESGSLLEAKGSMGSFVAEPAAEAAPAPTPIAPAAPVEEPVAAPAAPAEEAAAPWSDVTQRKLDRYFARMRQVYPDGVIVRLNTGQKKLAERGARSAWKAGSTSFLRSASSPIAAVRAAVRRWSRPTASRKGCCATCKRRFRKGCRRWRRYSKPTIACI